MTNFIFKFFTTAAVCSVMLSLCSCDMLNSELNQSDMANRPFSSQTPFESSSPMATDDMSSDAHGISSAVSDTENAIKDFVEGTIVDIKSVPAVVKAVTDKYPKATVTGITHAMHLNKQVYEVKYTDDKGTAHTVYVSPDGKSIEEAVEPEASSTPTISSSPQASDSVIQQG